MTIIVFDKIMRKTFSRLFLSVVLLTLVSCHTATKVTYLQDMMPDVSINLQNEEHFKLAVGDKVSVVVHGRDQDIVKMFNLGEVSTSTSSNNSSEHLLYTVDDNGMIDMPILGPVAVAGLTRGEVANLVKYRLLSSKLVRDPTVTVEFANLSYTILGEVGAPGRKRISRDKLTLLEAIAEAGDLTIQGRRDNILVLRTEGGTQTPYRVDITNTQDLYSSPVFYLKQNDMIYVQPTDLKANQSTVNGNSMLTPTFWFSVVSFITTLVVFFTK